MDFHVSNNTLGTRRVMSLVGDGHVGIGVTTPQENLEIEATETEIRLTDGRASSGGVAGEELGRISWYSRDTSDTDDYGAVASIDVVADNTSNFPSGRFLFRTGIIGGLFTRMVINRFGHVGIGTTDPETKLHVAGVTTLQSFSGSNGGGAWMKESSGAGSDEIDYADNTGSTNVSIYAEGSIVADGEGVFVAATVNWSDQRIKQIDGVSDAAQDLATIKQIEITDYRRIDGGKPEKKIIAQQLRELFPQAVSLREGVLPSIYAHIESFEFDPESGLLAIHTPEPHGLEAGDLIDYYTEAAKFGKQAVVDVLSDTQFLVEASAAPEELFVFGQWVDDVDVVDYDAVSMLNVSATQEQQRLIERQQAEVGELRATVAELERLVEALLSRPGGPQAAPEGGAAH